MSKEISLFGTVKEVLGTVLRSGERLVKIADQGTQYALEAAKVARLEAINELEISEESLKRFEEKVALLERIK